MIRPGYAIPIAFLIGITIWLIFLRDPPPLADCPQGPRHHVVAQPAACLQAFP